MTAVDYEKAVFALACWREMRSLNLTGMMCAGMVLRNRANAGWFQGSIYLNAIAANQLTSMTHKGDPNTVAWPQDTRDPLFLQLLQAVDGIYDGSTPDRTDNALYYAVISESTSPWFLENIARKPDEHPRTMQIGNTVFFR